MYQPKFKVGDKVRLKNTNYWWPSTIQGLTGKTGIITYISKHWPTVNVEVELLNECMENVMLYESEIELADNGIQRAKLIINSHK